MPFTISIHSRLVHIKWHGTIVQDDILSVLGELPLVAQRMGTAPDVMHTFDGVTTFQLSVPDVHLWAQRAGHVKLDRPVRSAVVASRPLVHGIARAFQGLNGNPGIEMQIFETKEEALHWLLQEKIYSVLATV